MLLVSACLAGVNCRYDGDNNFNKDIANLVKDGKAILICPEQMGGLTTPRMPCEIIIDDQGNRKVVDKNGRDVTQNFIKGAKEALNIAKRVNAKKAILKSRSPSCGAFQIYDGTFGGKIINGTGITAELFSKHGIEIFTEENYKCAFDE
ncbi:DUF523 domain-containing protein [Clostridiisalibacter paucivorans]|uniref:DUF523 domain-containing protein n=1 Tax=Clostridiisalibacter paucivorans TaxID=408753 RepID=UPI00047D1CA0|nr:DUF523 domain-containing protein [Clostridiisalibacter paucivorans]